jgi:hypothetical protein
LVSTKVGTRVSGAHAARLPLFRDRPPPAPNAAANDWYAWALAQSTWGETGAPAKSARRLAKRLPKRPFPGKARN